MDHITIRVPVICKLNEISPFCIFCAKKPVKIIPIHLDPFFCPACSLGVFPDKISPVSHSFLSALLRETGMLGIEHSLQKSAGACPTKMRSREGIPNHIYLKNIREDMVSILALLRTRASVEFSVRAVPGSLLQE